MDREMSSIADSLASIRDELRELKNIHTEAKNLNEKLDKLLIVFHPQDKIVPPVPILSIRSPVLIKEFLSKQNIDIITFEYSSDNPEEGVLDSISRFIGDRCYDTVLLIDNLKSKISSGDRLTLNLKEESQTRVANICQLSTALHRLALIPEFQYQRSPQYILKALPPKSPEAIAFLTGKWLEIYVRLKFIDAVKNRGIAYSYMQGVSIRLQNGDIFELDFLCEIEGVISWMECKTGEFQQHLERYRKFKNLMGLHTNHATLVISDKRADSDTRQKMRELYSINFIAISEVEEYMMRIVNLPKTLGESLK